jgi:hypothetical protein
MTPQEGLTADAVKGLALGDLGSAEVLDIERIQIDPDYQRDVRHDLVNQIGRNFDIVKAGPILVSERQDGSLWCVDGQHRMLGALQAGETEIFAHVVHGLSQAKEAELRLARNERRSDSIYEKFRSRLVMGDEKAHAVVEVIKQQGGVLNYNGANSHTGINAIQCVEQLYNADGNGVWLARTLRMIREAFTTENSSVNVLNPENCSASMMKATCWFIAQHIDSKEASWGEFASKLGTFGVDDIRRKAVSHKAANGGAMWVNYYRALVEIWNMRRTEARKIRWKTVGSFSSLPEKTGTNSTFLAGGKGASNW